VFTLTPDDYKNFFEPFIDKFSFSLLSTRVYNKGDVAEKQLFALQALKENTEFIIDVLDFIQLISDEAGGKKLILYPFTSTDNGFGLWQTVNDPKVNNYLSKLRGAVNEWRIPNAKDPNSFGIYYDPDDPTVFNNLLPVFISLLLSDPHSFVVRVVEGPNDLSTNDEKCYFIIDLTGNILPGEFKGTKKLMAIPKGGLVWTDGNNEDYKETLLYRKWREIISKHKIIGVPQFSNPDDFFKVVNDPAMGKVTRYCEQE